MTMSGTVVVLPWTRGSVIEITGRVVGRRMITVNRWSGRETRLLRHALRLTVRDFAEDLGVSPRIFSKWEAGGAAHEPRPELQRALDTTLARASEEERSRFAEVVTQTRLAAGKDRSGWSTPARPSA